MTNLPHAPKREQERAPERQLERVQEPVPGGIAYHDLQTMTRWSTALELMHPLPWLLVSFVLFASPIWPIGFAASFMFFLCGLRLNHEAIHSNLGLTPLGDRLVFHALSFLMGGSNHAVAHGHRVHHADALGPSDFEGKCGHMSLWHVLRYGPKFIVDINRVAWLGSKPFFRKRITIDWGLNLLLVGLVVVIGWQFLLLHLVAITIAQCLTALFAVWITHQGMEGSQLIARSQRGWLARAAYLMFYHREHHLFPNVPVRKLPELARRLDEGVPGYAAERMAVVPWFDRRGDRAV